MQAIRQSLLRCGLMKILIENAESAEFLTTHGTWTKKAADGRQFGNTVLAFDVAKKESIGKFNIVCHIPATNQFINMNHGKGKGATEVVTAEA